MVDHLSKGFIPHSEAMSLEDFDRVSGWISDRVDAHNHYWKERDGSLAEGYADACNLAEQDLANWTSEMGMPGQIAVGGVWGISKTLVGIPIGLTDIMIKGIGDTARTKNPLNLIATPVELIIKGMGDMFLHIGSQANSWFIDRSLRDKNSYQISNEVMSTLLVAGLMVMGLKSFAKGGGNLMSGGGGVLADLVKKGGTTLSPALAGANVSVGSTTLVATGVPIFSDLVNGAILMQSVDKGTGGSKSKGSCKAKGRVKILKRGGRLYVKFGKHEYLATLHDDGILSFRRYGAQHFIDSNGVALKGTLKKPLIVKTRGSDVGVVIDDVLYDGIRGKDGGFVLKNKDGVQLIGPRGKQIDISGKKPIYFESGDGVPHILHEGTFQRAYTGKNGIHYIIDERFEVRAFLTERRNGRVGFIREHNTNNWFHMIDEDALFSHKYDFEHYTIGGSLYKRVASDGHLSFFRSGDRVIAVDAISGKRFIFGRGYGVPKINFGRNRIISDALGKRSVIIYDGDAYVVLERAAGKKIAYARNVKGGMNPANSEGLKVFELSKDKIRILSDGEVAQRFSSIVHSSKSSWHLKAALEKPSEVKVKFVRSAERVTGPHDGKFKVTFDEYEVSVIGKGGEGASLVVEVPRESVGIGKFVTVQPRLEGVVNAIRELPISLTKRCSKISLEPYVDHPLIYQRDSGYRVAVHRILDGHVKVFRVKPRIAKNGFLREVLGHEFSHAIEKGLSSNRRAIMDAVILDGKHAMSFMRARLNNYFMRSPSEFFCEAVPQYLKNPELFRGYAPRMAEFIEFKLAELEASGVNVSNPTTASMVLILYVLGEGDVKEEL